jgi:hypothetical protein
MVDFHSRTLHLAATNNTGAARYPVDKQTYNVAARGGSLRMVQWLYRVAPDAMPASIALDAAYSGNAQLAAWLQEQALGRWDQESLSHM